MAATASTGIDISKKKRDCCAPDPGGGGRREWAVPQRDAGRGTGGAGDGAQVRREKWRMRGSLCVRRRHVACHARGVWGRGGAHPPASPYRLKMITGSAKKTDGEDARRLAVPLRSGMIDACRVPTGRVRGTGTPYGPRNGAMYRRKLNKIKGAGRGRRQSCGMPDPGSCHPPPPCNPQTAGHPTAHGMEVRRQSRQSCLRGYTSGDLESLALCPT